ncbi:MAG: glycosyltransferase family 4 protein [Planctomycetota bacterium]
MKSAFVIPHADRARGGAEAYLMNLVEDLSRWGRHCVILCRDHGALPQGVQAVRLRGGGFTASGRIRRFWASVHHHLLNNSYAVVQALDISPGVTLANPHGGVEAIWLRQYLKSKVGLERSWASMARRLSARERTVFKYEAMMYASPTLRKVIAISPFVKDGLREIHDIPLEKIAMIPNGVDPVRFSAVSPGFERQTQLMGLLLDPAKPVILFVGHNFALKGLRPFLRTLQKLRREGFPVQGIVVGRGRRAPFEHLAHTMGLSDCIRWAGVVTDMPALYRSCDVLLAPSYYDACSLATLEALFCGLPVVTSRFNGASLYVKEGLTGSIHEDPDDTDEVSVGVARFLDAGVRDLVRTEGPTSVASFTREANSRAVWALHQSTG